MRLARLQSDRSQGPLSFPSSARDYGMENGSHGVCSPTTHSSLADPVLPGLPRPGTFRPQGLITLSTICSPPGLVLIRRTGQRSWGFPFRVLLLPTGGTPLGAAPLLSFHRPAFAGMVATPEVSPVGKGNENRRRKRRRPPNLTLLGLGLSRAFSFVALGPASRSEPLLPFRLEVLPTFLLPGEVPGDCEQRKRLVFLKTACPPEVLHLPVPARVCGLHIALAYGFASARRPLRAACAVPEFCARTPRCLGFT
jgi:hypothetical protein